MCGQAKLKLLVLWSVIKRIYQIQILLTFTPTLTHSHTLMGTHTDTHTDSYSIAIARGRVNDTLSGDCSAGAAERQPKGGRGVEVEGGPRGRQAGRP